MTWRSVALVAVVLIVGVWAWATRSMMEDNKRLRRNQQTLSEEVVLYRTKAEESAASVQALELSVREFRRLRSEDAERIRSLGVRLRRAESYATAASTTIHRDTVIMRDTVIREAAVRYFRDSTPWHSVMAILWGDSLRYSVRSVDTLRQVVHRVPRKFLFIRYGTKAIRQEIVSSNPNTTLVYSEYVEFK